MKSQGGHNWWCTEYLGTIVFTRGSSGQLTCAPINGNAQVTIKKTIGSFYESEPCDWTIKRLTCELYTLRASLKKKNNIFKCCYKCCFHLGLFFLPSILVSSLDIHFFVVAEALSVFYTKGPFQTADGESAESRMGVSKAGQHRS